MRALAFNIPAFLIAVMATYLTASPLLTVFNLSAINTLGYAVSPMVGITTILQDLLGLLGLYAPVLGFALCLAFVFTHFVLGRLFKPGLFLYALAGFVAVMTAHLAMNSIIGLIVLAPVRSYFGLLSQAAAGAVGGAVFWMFRRRFGEK